jgi:hypothetical protein
MHPKVGVDDPWVVLLPVSFDENHLMDCGPWSPLQWVAERHFIDPKCIEYMAGPVFELFTAASVSELADSRPGDERDQILRLAGTLVGTGGLDAFQSPCFRVRNLRYRRLYPVVERFEQVSNA